MKGMNRIAGSALEGSAHLAQSIADILSTPIGSRVMRRDYGSLLPELVDAPANPAGELAIFSATAMALAKWEPRFRLRRVTLTRDGAAGHHSLLLEGDRLDLPRATPASLSIPLSLSARPVAPAFA